MLRLRALLALLLLALAASPAAAWWEYGHETVARIAWSAMAPATRREVAALLRRDRLLATPTCPARTIEQASVWADCVKPLGDRFSYMYAWHYQDVDICRPFDLAAPCADGNCVSAQIARAARMLRDRALPVRERLTALVLLIHLVGDLHQPLHAGEHGDQGGNQVRAAYGLRAGRTNLHMIWDGLLAERAISTPPAGAEGLLAGLSPARREAFAAGTVEDWSRESWQVARDIVYPAVLADPCGPAPAAARTMDEATVRRLVPVVRAQVLKGGLRLARLLDDAVAGRVPPRGTAG